MKSEKTGPSGTSRVAVAPSRPPVKAGASDSAVPQRLAPPRGWTDVLLDKTIAFFTSLRLTVVLLVLGLFLVFLGTLAQVDLGLYKAQNAFFRSFFVYWGAGSRFSRVATWSAACC